LHPLQIAALEDFGDEAAAWLASAASSTSTDARCPQHVRGYVKRGKEEVGVGVLVQVVHASHIRRSVAHHQVRRLPPEQVNDTRGGRRGRDVTLQRHHAMDGCDFLQIHGDDRSGGRACGLTMVQFTCQGLAPATRRGAQVHTARHRRASGGIRGEQVIQCVQVQQLERRPRPKPQDCAHGEIGGCRDRGTWEGRSHNEKTPYTSCTNDVQRIRANSPLAWR